MKATIQDSYGSPDVLHLVELDRPQISADQVLVQVYASPVTQGDRRLRSADFPGISWLPGRLMMGLLRPRNRIPGTMFAGRVVAVGEAVTRFAVGDDVFGSVDHSAHAEYLALGESERLCRMPLGLDHAEAAAVPYGAVTALTFLRDLAELQPGQRVLILGASGGVGRFAVQLAKHMGAEVTGVCSRRTHELVRSLGADHLIDYRTQDFREQDTRYDLIFDTVGATSFGQCRSSLTPEGQYLSLIISSGLLLRALQTSVVGGQRAVFGVAMGSQEMLEQVRDLVECGALWPVVDRLPLALEQITEAHTRLESGQARGCVVVSVSRDAYAYVPEDFTGQRAQHAVH